MPPKNTKKNTQIVCHLHTLHINMDTQIQVCSNIGPLCSSSWCQIKENVWSEDVVHHWQRPPSLPQDTTLAAHSLSLLLSHISAQCCKHFCFQFFHQAKDFTNFKDDFTIDNTCQRYTLFLFLAPRCQLSTVITQLDTFTFFRIPVLLTKFQCYCFTWQQGKATLNGHNNRWGFKQNLCSVLERQYLFLKLLPSQISYLLWQNIRI